MSFDIRKTQSGQEIVYWVKLYADACQYSIPSMLAARDVVTDVSTSIAATGTGIAVVLTSGDATLFDATAVGDKTYMRLPTSNEVVEITITDASNVTIVAREQFGTVAQALSGVLNCRIMHKGEADDSCDGFPGGCSSADSWTGVSHEFIITHAPLSAGTIYHNGLDFDSVRRTGPEADPGESMGMRGSFSCIIDDELDELDLFNPYRDRISTGGTRFGKMLARHPYFNARKCVFGEGLRDPGEFEMPEFQEYAFVLDSVDLSGGRLSIRGLDPLILTEGKKAKMPLPSVGQLEYDISGSPANFTYVNAGDYYYGENGSTVFVRIDSETIECTVSAAKQLTPVTRGYKSDVKDHSAGATIQFCEKLEGHVVDEIVRIIETYTDTPSEFIDDYTAVKALMPGKEIDGRLVTKPTDVNVIINNLIKVGDLNFYFGPITSKIVMEYYPELEIQPVNLNDNDHFKAESLDLKRNEVGQITRFTYMWAPYDCTKEGEEYHEFVHTVVNATLESGRYLGTVNEKKTDKSLVLTNSTNDTLLGAAYVARVIERNNSLPMILTATLDAENIGNTQSGDVSPGTIINISSRIRQNEKGQNVSDLFQIVKIDGQIGSNYKIKARRYNANIPDSIDYEIVGGTYINYDLSLYFAPESAGQYVIYIHPDVIFGSYNTTVPAFTEGTQAAGVTFKIIHRGKGLGQGGNGGNGGSITIGSGSDPGYDTDEGAQGNDGGVAFDFTVDTVLDCGSGVIWAGGGGQGGGRTSGHYIYTGSYLYYDKRAPGKSGGGGQGFGTSSAGTPGTIQDLSLTTGQYGTPGTQSEYGGGAWGEDGPPGVPNWLLEYTPEPGGLAGIAIRSNGNTVTIIAGDNAINIRGRRT